MAMITITASRDVTVGSDLRSVTTMDAGGVPLRDISPAFDPWYHRYQFGLRFIGGHRVRGSTLVWRWNRDHEVRRRLGMTHTMANPVETRRCRVPTMLRAMPIEVHRTKMLTRFGLAHAGR